MRVATPATPRATATTETVPTRCAVTTPWESTLAILGFVLAQTKATWPVMSVPCSLSARALNCADVPTAILVSVGCTSIRSPEIVTTIGCEPVRGVSVTANGGLEPLCTVMVVSARWVSTPAASKAEMRNCRSLPVGTVSVPVATPFATGKL